MKTTVHQKKHSGIGFAKILIALLFCLPVLSQAQSINRISASPLVGHVSVEKTIQAANGNYYVLCNGTDASPLSNEKNITVIYECTSNGGVIWCYKYGMAPSPSATSTLKGLCIATDNGGAASGKIGVGGYLSFDNSASHNNFVMELDTDGSVLWFKYWNYTTAIGVQDLLFNHEGAPNSGSITALSIDYNTLTTYTNISVTLISGTGGIIASEFIADAAEYEDGSPNGVGNKPRILESHTNLAYYVVGTRSIPGGRNIAFWTLGYGLVGIPSLNAYSETPDVSATGAVEDEGTYSAGGVPTVYICGYETTSSGTPLFIEVTGLGSATHTFTPLSVPPSTYFPSYVYCFPTDLTIEGSVSGGTKALMSTVNYYGKFTGGSINVATMLLYHIPMSFSLSPTCGINFLDFGTTSPVDTFGGICSSGNLNPYISAGYDGTNIVFINADQGPRVCHSSSPEASSQPMFSTSSTTSGSSVSLTLTSATPDKTSISKTAHETCHWVPTGPEPAGHGMLPAQNPESQNINTGVNGTGENNQISINAYPNPVTGSAFIDISGNIASAATVAIYDVAGRLLSTSNTNIEPGISHLTVDMHSLHPGMYIIQVSNPTKSINFRVSFEKQ